MPSVEFKKGRDIARLGFDRQKPNSIKDAIIEKMKKHLFLKDRYLETDELDFLDGVMAGCRYYLRRMLGGISEGDIVPFALGLAAARHIYEMQHERLSE